MIALFEALPALALAAGFLGMAVMAVTGWDPADLFNFLDREPHEDHR